MPGNQPLFLREPDMPAIITLQHDLDLWTGSKFSGIIAVVRDAVERQVVDLTGYSARGEVRRKPGTPTLLLALSSVGVNPTIVLNSSGEIRLELPASLLSSRIDLATWGIELTDASGNTQLAVWGTFVVRQSPVHPVAP